LGTAGDRQDDDRPAVGGATGLHFEQISAIFSGVADLKKVFEAARLRLQNGMQTLLFVDEIHRFNRAQQDSFLPVVEDGTILLVGATTENPSFELNAALLSRARVLTMKRLEPDHLELLLRNAPKALNEAGRFRVEEDARGLLAVMADGDGRAVLTLAEEVFRSTKPGETLDENGLATLSCNGARPFTTRARTGTTI
jgi:putative ATPase